MRIALFTETFLPKTDGIVNTLCHLLEHLARRGHESLLFAPAGAPSHYSRTPVIGLAAVPFPLYPELRLVPPTVDVSVRLAAFSPDLIHVLNPVSLGVAGLAPRAAVGRACNRLVSDRSARLRRALGVGPLLRPAVGLFALGA